jgi:head-tail adaptor
LSGNDLEYVKRTSLEALPDIVTIQRSDLEADTSGGATEEWASIYADIPARLAERSGSQESSVAGRESVVSGWTLTVGFDQDILEKDRVLFGTAIYEVVFVNEGRSYSTAKRCRLSRIS